MLQEITSKPVGLDNNNDLRKKAGRWLREKRCERGLSQRELARRVNMEYYTFISQIEAGRGRVPADRLRDWAEALEMDPKGFAINLMQFYDPHMYDMIYGSNS
mgnify:FL=1